MEIMVCEQYAGWLAKLKDRQAKARIVLKIRQIGIAGISVADYKSVGGGVNEFRFHFGAGYRVYFAVRGDEVLLLLAGGDKTSQARDIKKAQAILSELRKENKW
ncbi:type II toxin-antitoxin system RelE/ParE family toxin [Bifidobacterium pseudolongum]|uniref:type II toxin-antitoxin system RelE/ParE family toxin n=1 Tax=Bifidobacterium pseudolongum TaxID=1694 RepID=UPI001C3C9334|nr:type II toxin-antitoxin system RelE/ParE family toxin [Bifidobacterium pseudolongum]